MINHEYIDYVLANYFSASIGQSEDEAISTLQKHIASSPELATGLHRELEQALDDVGFSWKDALSEHDVLFTESEDEARQYARKVLWESVFVSS